MAAQLYCIFILGKWGLRFGEGLFPGLGFRILMAPAVILHELSHVMLCWLTLSKVSQVTVFQREGGSVSHDKPRVPFGQVLISLAPFIGGWALMHCLAGLTGLPWGDEVMKGGWNQWWPAQWASFAAFSEVTGDGWTSVLWVYSAASCALIMIPSPKDLDNARAPFLVLVGAFLMLDAAMWVFRGSSMLPGLMIRLSPHVLSMLSVQVALLLLLAPLAFARKSLT